MKLAIFTLIFFSSSYCFAQINPMEYFYEGKEIIPDFAALAVLESQHCPNPLAIKNYEYNEYEKYEEQICTSRYRIIRVLDSSSDTLKKEYLEAKEKPMVPDFKYRPMLIFGEYMNGTIQITGYESPRYYQNFSPFVDYINDNIDAFHSIGTPYFNLKNSDNIDMFFYNEYLMPHIKYKVETAGKNYYELLRLTKNRTPINAIPIKNKFVAFGAIKSMRPASDSKRANLYELNLTIENVIKNDAKMGPNIAIFIDKDRLSPVRSCQPLDYYSNDKIPFYFFGDLKNGSLFVDSLVSPQDAFVFGDTIYDISMGFLYEELIAYFFPPNISLEEFKCQRNASIETATKWKDFLDNRPKEKVGKWGGPFVGNFPLTFRSINLNPFRCRRYDPCIINNSSGCRKYYFEGERAVWGNVSIINQEGIGEVKADKKIKANRVKSKKGDLQLKYIAGDVRTFCRVRFDEEMTIVKELEYYVLVKASCGRGWLRKADVEKVLAEPCDKCFNINPDEIMQGPCAIL